MMRIIRRREYSLKRHLLIRLGASLFVVIAIGGIGAFVLARHVGHLVHDRWLFDSAMTLAGQIKFDGDRPTLELPHPAVEMFEWDSVDHIYEEVSSRKWGYIFGNARFPAPPTNLTLKQPVYYNGDIKRKPVRIVTVMLPNPRDRTDVLLVQVAETWHKRATLALDTMTMAMPLQLIIFLITSALIWMAVKSSLRTLDDIAERLAGYDPHSNIPPISDVDNAPLEVKPLVRSLNQLVVKLSEAQNLQRRFVSNAAHQLRTPLATLQVQTERALREPDPARHGEALSHVLSAVTRLRRVVHQLLVLARSDRSDEQPLTMTQVDLAAMARNELERWADAAIARGIDLGYDGPEVGVEITGEPNLLRELIGNLVDNAIRYGRVGGEVTLGLTVMPPSLYVDDDGEGIPAEERTLVLERFYRRSNATGEGCGLGLPIACEIAGRHDAQLSISDNPRSSGTRVTIVFPELRK